MRALPGRLQPNPLAVLGVAGIGVATIVALISESYVTAVSPTVKGADPAGTVKSLHWIDGRDQIAVGVADGFPYGVFTDGTISTLNYSSDKQFLRALTSAFSGRYGAESKVHALSDNVKVETPGRLFAVDSDGSLMVTGEAIFQSTIDTVPAPSIPEQSRNPQSLWRLTPGPSGALTNAYDWSQPITAMAAMPDGAGMAIGGAKGGVAVVRQGAPALTRVVKRSPYPSVSSPVLALAAARSNRLVPEGVDFATLSSNRRIQIWRADGVGVLGSWPVALPSLFRFGPESLSLSSAGETLAAKATDGSVFVARLVDDDRRSARNGASRGAAMARIGRQPGPFTVAIVVSPRESQAEFARLRAALPRFSGSGLTFSPASLQTADVANRTRRFAFVPAERPISVAAARELRALNSPLIEIYPRETRAWKVQALPPATASALSRNGERLFAAGTDCLIREVDLTSLFKAWAPASTRAETLLTLRGHGAPITNLALSASGEYLAAVDLTGRIRIHRLDRARSVDAVPLAAAPTGPECPATDLIPITLPPRPDPAPVAGNETAQQPAAQQPAAEQPQQQQVDQQTKADEQTKGDAPLRRSNELVFVQFAGAMTRDDVVAFSKRLSELGWNVQGVDRGGERLEAAARLNEVRYGPETDRGAALRLAEDATSARAGTNKGPPLRAVLVKSIRPESLEIWMSN